MNAFADKQTTVTIILQLPGASTRIAIPLINRQFIHQSNQSALPAGVYSLARLWYISRKGRGMDLHNKIKGLSTSELASKGIHWALTRAKPHVLEMWARSGGFQISPSHLMASVKGHPLDPNQAASKILDSIYRFSPPVDAYILARDSLLDQVETLIADAEHIVQKKFTIFGTDVDYSNGIRWHYDPANKYEFAPGEFYSRIPHSNPNGGSDIKYPWELSRLQHFPRLALAYRWTGDKKFRAALIDQTSDWLRSNPVGFGPNWACTMDVAIRAANLSYAFAILADRHLESDFKISLATSLLTHGRFIASNLEWSETLTSNHYPADIAGLAVLAAQLSDAVSEAETWLEFCRSELVSELDKQVYPDGCDFEASTAYHQLVLDFFKVSTIFLKEAGLEFDDRYYRKLGQMQEFLSDISFRNGEFPLIGDNDSGLFLRLFSIFDNNAILLLSPYGSGDLIQKKIDSQIDELTIAEYPHGGLYIIKNRSRNDLVTFRLGQVGQKGNGGHAHNDQLSVTIWFDGRQVIADPGSAVYTSDPVKRNLYRSTLSHATIALADIEQNPFVPGNLFTLPQKVKTEFIGSKRTEDYATFEGAIHGYGDFRLIDVRMQRTVTYNQSRRQVEIHDEVTLKADAAKITPEWIFPLGPGLAVDIRSGGYVKIADEMSNPAAEILFLPGWRVSIVETRYSPAYGVEVPNVTLVFQPPDGTTFADFIIRAALSSGNI